jgi:uncharacterized damage-inducible protein DinB
MLNLDLDDLLSYTDWERQKWREFLESRGEQLLTLKAGEHGDGRFQTIGDLIRHIFSGEKRYVERLLERTLTDTTAIPNNQIEALFEFGRQSRAELRRLIASFPPAQWDTLQELKFGNSSVTATPRKIVTHVVLHEVRHWAQVATLFRLNGLTADFHDFLFSPVMGGEMKRGA